MRLFTPTRPVWSRTAATSTTPAVVYIPTGVAQIKLTVDAQSLALIGDTYAAPSTTRADEVLTITTVGTPTGGTFTLLFDGFETSALTYDESAADVVTALNALDNVASGDLVGAGGALPTAITLTAAQVYDATGPLPPLVLGTNSLTGGTNPSVHVRRSTEGSGPTNPYYAYVEADVSEIFDVAPVVGTGRRARYLYVAAVTGTGNYWVSGYAAR